MKLILNNPYRITGLLAGATAREQTRQITRLKQYLEAEQQPESDFSFPFLGNLNRTLKKVEEAESNLNLDNDKIKAALFWFWNGNPITDEVAFQALQDGDIIQAIKIWTDLIHNGEVTQRNASAYHNLSVLYLSGILLGADMYETVLDDGIYLKLQFLEDYYFKLFKKAVTDETYQISNKEVQLIFLEEIVETKSIDLSLLIDIISEIDFIAKDDFIKSFAQEPINKINAHIETAKTRRRASERSAINVGENLLRLASIELKQLRKIIKTDDYTYTSISDKVANEVLQCSIDYYNYKRENENDSLIPQEHLDYIGESNEDYAETSLALAKEAKKIAYGSITRERVEDTINTLEQMKHRELNEAIAFLKSVKTAFEKNEKEIKLTVKNMTLGPNESINWDKVNQVIYDSINWDMVVRDVQEVITQKNIEKIKQSDNTAKVREYKALVDFLMSKLNYPNKKKLEYLKFWEEGDLISSTPKSRIITPTQTNNSRTSTYQVKSTAEKTEANEAGYKNENSSLRSFAKNAWWIVAIIGGVISAIFTANDEYLDGDLMLVIIGLGVFWGGIIGNGLGKLIKDRL